IAAIKVKQEIKNKALSSNDTPGQMFSEVIGNLDVDVLAELPKEEYLKRVLDIIDGEWALMGNNRLLLRDNCPEASERIIIFATDEHLQLLSELDTWKTKNTYVEMFQIIIMDECAERNLYPDPKCLHLDFESSVIEAAK
ncbi:Uncharacterized protein FWK35_00034011, partial [Aphis craccivora]